MRGEEAVTTDVSRWFKRGEAPNLARQCDPRGPIALTCEAGGSARPNHALTRSSSFCRGMGDLGKFASWNLCIPLSRVGPGGASPGSQLQEAPPMLQLTLFPDNPPGPRWISPPWTTASDRWREIDRDLPADHRARQIPELVATLDLAPLVGSYAGLGSAAHPPELLVRLALFEIHRGCLSPARWCEDCRYDDAVKWLVWGLRPSRSCLYQFRDRIGPYLDSWNRQILRRAQTEGWTSAKRAALDGTFAAAYASRHTLINAQTLASRCQQLDEAVAADFAARRGKPPEPGAAAAATPASAPAAVQAGGGAEPDPRPGPAADSPGPGATEEPVPAGPPSGPPSPGPTAGVAPAPPATAAVPSAPARPSWMATTPAGRFGQRQRYRRAQEQMTQRQRHRQKTMSQQSKAQRQSPARMKISPSEPETVLGRDKTKVFRPLYNIQLACDLDSSFVLGSGVFAVLNDAPLFGPLLKRTGGPERDDARGRVERWHLCKHGQFEEVR